MTETILDDFCITRNLSDETRKLYTSAINQYTQFNNMNMMELLEEAEIDEEKGVRWKYRKVRKRLMKYRIYLINKYIFTTAKKYFSLILTVYRHYEIELQQLPSISNRNVDMNKPLEYKDLPDDVLIEKILSIANIKARALIFFMLSSGCARTETANITIRDYVEAVSDYTDGEDDIYEVLNILKDKDDVVPTFMVLRQKTKKHYVTFCTPEAVNAINIYLGSYGKKLEMDDLLFHCKPRSINGVFANLNDKLGLGKKDCYNVFRPHILRKFHASRLYDDGMSMDLVDSLQGRVKDKVRGVYFLDNPDRLKKEYFEHMGAVCVEWNMRNITFKSKEFLDLERENYEKQVLLDELSERLCGVEEFVFKGLSERDLDEMRKYI